MSKTVHSQKGYGTVEFVTIVGVKVDSNESVKVA